MIKKIIFKIFGICAVLLFVKFIITVVAFNDPLRILKGAAKEILVQETDKSLASWLWQDGRTFVYEIDYCNIFSPGSATLSVIGEELYKNKPVIRLEASLQPNIFIKSLYDARMQLACAVSPSDKLSLWYREKSVTPEKTKVKEIDFDRVKNIAKREDMKYAIPHETCDPLSVFFNFLDHRFVLGEPIVLQIFSKEEIYEFRATPIEESDSIYLVIGEVFRQDKSSSHGAKFEMWIKDGSVRIPLLIKLTTPAGFVYLRLKEVK